jgi:hypothetical protein
MADHASRSHRKFAASAAERWMNCAGSVALCKGLPEQRSSYAEEGTRAHELLEKRLKTPGTTYAMVVNYDQESWDATDVAVDYVNARRAAHSNSSLLIERQVTPEVCAAPDDVGGTADIILYYPDELLLEVVDYKHGAGVAVEAKGNKQMRVYALGAWQNLKLEVQTIRTTIIQPRAFHPDGPIRSEDLSVAELMDFHVDLEEAAERCLQPDAPLVPGEAQCRWCPAKTICPALESRALAIAGEAFTHVRQITPEALPDARTLTPDRIGYILQAKRALLGWLEAVEEEGYRLAMAGTQIPGSKLVAATGRRAFEGTVEEVSKQLEAITGLPAKEFTKETLLGVVEAETLVKRQAKDKKKALEAFAFLTTKKSSGKLQLVADDDKRPAVVPVSEAFAGVVQLPHITGDSE